MSRYYIPEEPDDASPADLAQLLPTDGLSEADTPELAHRLRSLRMLATLCYHHYTLHRHAQDPQ
ncbi:MAG: hypothetical protein KF690_07090 [Bacteroidetes bacterium]|nr:hypothetical protein [Bacteroidota bacterium]